MASEYLGKRDLALALTPAGIAVGVDWLSGDQSTLAAISSVLGIATVVFASIIGYKHLRTRICLMLSIFVVCTVADILIGSSAVAGWDDRSRQQYENDLSKEWGLAVEKQKTNKWIPVQTTFDKFTGVKTSAFISYHYLFEGCPRAMSIACVPRDYFWHFYYYDKSNGCEASGVRRMKFGDGEPFDFSGRGRFVSGLYMHDSEATLFRLEKTAFVEYNLALLSYGATFSPDSSGLEIEIPTKGLKKRLRDLYKACNIEP